MKKVKHVTTGAIFYITKVAPKTIYLVCIEQGNCPGLKAGDKQKTTPLGLQTFYINI